MAAAKGRSRWSCGSSRVERPVPLPLAIGLSAMAGYVDAVGYLRLGGTFVSFMSGNSTQFAVGLSAARSGSELLIAAIIPTFVAGVVIGNLLHGASGRAGSPAVLGLVTLLLLAGAALQQAGVAWLAIGLTALAMGAVNTAFEHRGQARMGLTYMTGTLVRAGDHFAQALRGGPLLGWAPDALLWGGLIVGATTGGLIYRAVGFQALWGAPLAAGLATAAVLAYPLNRRPG